MGKNEKTPITVNDTEYFVDDMTDAQKTMLNHVNDLERKLANARFNLDQLAIGRDAFVNMLAQSLEAPEEAEVVKLMEMDALLNMVFAAVISGLGWWIKSQHDEIKRVTILLNRTREEMAKEYVTKDEVLDRDDEPRY
jgi:hypothetical protein